MAGSPFTAGQASGGMSPMTLLAPDIYQQQLQLNRQQQYADMLKQQGAAGGRPTEVVNGWAVRQSPLEGLSRVMSAVGGQVMQSQIDQKNMALAQALNQRMFGGSETAPQPAPIQDASNALQAGANTMPSTPNATGALVNQGGVGPTVQNAAALSASQPQTAPPQGGIAGNFFNMPGMDSRQVQLAMMLNPDAMTKALIEQHNPTDISKMGMQGGLTPQQIQAANAAGIGKANYIAPTRLGEGAYNDPSTGVQGLPTAAPQGYINVKGADGSWSTQPVAGGLDAAQNAAYAGAAGKAATVPLAGVNPETGTSGWTNNLAAAGGGMPNGPFKNYTPSGGASGQSAGGLAPAANPGVNAAATTMATTNANNYSSLQGLASTSPDRVNILDNMLELAKGSTQFGPGWEGRMDRVASLNSALPSGMALGTNDMANAQIMQKYMSNLVQQNQKALGGTGTDQQMSMIMHGTPTPDMMNKAMIDVIPKLKAQELALQAKASAANDFMVQNNNNPAALNKFENNWRQNYDPRIYQMQQMAPADRAAFMAKQPDPNVLRVKAQTALTNGWVQ